MKKFSFSFLIILTALVALASIMGYLKFLSLSNSDVVPVVNTPAEKSNPQNISYSIDGESIQLVNGKAERLITPDSTTKETYTLFGEPTFGDIDSDGDLDAVSYLTRDGGGSGIFYYVVVAVNASGTYRGTNAMFLGDRIAPQNINFLNGKAVANFAERKVGEPFTTPPSMGKSVWIHLDTKTNQIGELVQNFEGEADSSKMSLPMKKWNWISINSTDGSKVFPKKSDVFTLTFNNNGTFSATTDCNGVGGEYISKGNSITFNKMMSTLMYCEGSQEQEFTSMLGDVKSYHFTGKGELIFELKENKGSTTFR